MTAGEGFNDSERGNGEHSAPAVLIDTNVWIDFFIGDRPCHEGARVLFAFIGELGATPLYAVHSSKDAYFIIRSTLKRQIRLENGGVLSPSDAAAADEIAWACLENMTSVGVAVGCDQTDVWLAEKQRAIHGDYEDDLLIAAAMRAKAPLVTNDGELLRHCPVAAMDVRDATKWLEAQAKGIASS